MDAALADGPVPTERHRSRPNACWSNHGETESQRAADIREGGWDQAGPAKMAAGFLTRGQTRGPVIGVESFKATLAVAALRRGWGDKPKAVTRLAATLVNRGRSGGRCAWSPVASVRRVGASVVYGKCVRL